MSSIFQKSFAGGELCPGEYARCDLVKYATGMRTMRNFYVARHGGAYNRPGTQYIGQQSSIGTGHRIRLIPFDLPGNIHYQLEFGHLYVRPLLNGQPFNLSIKTINYISIGTQTAITFNEYTSMQVGESFVISGIVSGPTQLNGQTATITAIQAQVVGSPAGVTSVIVNINSSSYTPGPVQVIGQVLGFATPTNAREVRFTTTYTEAMLRDLTFVQSDNSLVIAHQSNYPLVMTYFAPESWILANDFQVGYPTMPQVTNIAQSGGTAGTTPLIYAITAIKQDTFEEGPQSPFISTTFTGVRNLTWNAVPNAVQYNIYIGTDATALGFLHTVTTNKLAHNSADVADYTTPPPIEQVRISNGVYGGNQTYSPMYPACVGYYQQRRYFGNLGPINVSALGPPAIQPMLPNFADRIYGSRIGSLTYFYATRPTTDDGFLSFRLLNKVPQEVRHFLDVGKLLVFTTQGEWLIAGDPNSGGVTPSLINPTQVGQDGSGATRPLAIGQVAMFVNIDVNLKTCRVKSLGYTFQTEGYQGNDLTINSSHLFDNHSIVAWDYQKLPDPIVWGAREDGTLLGMTWVPEQAMVAWHRHDFVNGIVEDVVSSAGVTYLVISRTINGAQIRCIERFASRDYKTISDAIFVDSCVTWDGRSGTPQFTGNGMFPPSGVTLSGGTNWDYTELLTLTSGGLFTSSFVNNFIHLTAPDGSIIRFKVTAFVNSTTVKGYVQDQPVPTTLQNVLTLNWAYAVVSLTGLTNLAGQQVSILGDGYIISSVNNPDYPTATVGLDGSLQIGDGTIGYAVIQVGLPITSDLETLNIDNPSGPSMMDKKKQVTKLTMFLDSSRNVFVGGDKPDDDNEPATNGLFNDLTEIKYSDRQEYGIPKALITRAVEINIQPEWNSTGRVFIRQVDPLPTGILAIAPSGFIPIGSP